MRRGLCRITTLNTRRMTTIRTRTRTLRTSITTPKVRRASYIAIKGEKPDEAIRELQDILDAETDMTEWYVFSLTQGFQGAEAADQDQLSSRPPRRGAALLPRAAQVYQVCRDAQLYVCDSTYAGRNRSTPSLTMSRRLRRRSRSSSCFTAQQNRCWQPHRVTVSI